MKDALCIAFGLAAGFALTFAVVAYAEGVADPFAWPRETRGAQVLIGIGLGLFIAAGVRRK